MLWEVEIRPKAGLTDYEGQRVLAESRELGSTTIDEIKTAKSFLIETVTCTTEELKVLQKEPEKLVLNFRKWQQRH